MCVNDAALCLCNASQTMRSGSQGWTTAHVSEAQSHEHWFWGFIIPGTDAISSVTVHKPLAPQGAPVLHGAGVRKREKTLHWSKILGCCKTA